MASPDHQHTTGYPLWKGVRILKHPHDMISTQEVIWDTKPDVVVETGSKYGGSANFYADLGCEVHSVDIAPPYEPAAHPNVTYYRGRSVSPQVLFFIGEAIQGKRVMVILDSDHHKQTVLDELNAYAPFVTPGCYLIVEDTVFGRTIHLDDHKNDGPADALDEWLPDHPEFVVDRERERFGVTDHPGGYLLRT